MAFFSSPCLHPHFLHFLRHFGTPSHEKVPKMTPKRVPRGTRNPPKIDKNPGVDPKVSCGVSLGTPRSPKWCPGVPTWSLQTSQVADLGAKNHPIQRSDGIASPSSPSNLSSPPSPADPASPAIHWPTGHPRGRRQGRSLKIKSKKNK